MNLIPFRPLVYRGDLEGTTSPPVDIISQDHEARLKSSPFNITHITMPRHGILENALGTLAQWRKDGVLETFGSDCLIILDQEIHVGGRRISRIGIISPVETSPERKDVLAHEETFPWAVEERRKLMEKTSCQLEPIFLTVNGTSFERILRAAVRQMSPAKTFQEPDGVANSVYFLTDPRSIESIRQSLQRENAVVADGHHRLQATRNLYLESNGENRDFWKFTMAYVTSLQSDSLLIGGIHRVVSREFEISAFMESIREYFDVREMNGDHGQESIVLYDGKYHSISPKPIAFDAIGCSKKYKYAGDPSLVSNLILRQIMGMTQKDLSTKVLYTHNRVIAVDEVDSGRSGFSFLMPEWNKSVFISMIEDGRLLPQKSTYFYPKVPSGIALYCSDSIRISGRNLQ
ncbi:MAG: hypothetical protein AMDU1_APLC00046G0022 [Thermoplasmatales archaeon A-plasma]|nr:MAG: hypothetical protein AMDU1_APLC00046G0022 [Thermoplasmatales archaeon A-plasma]